MAFINYTNHPVSKWGEEQRSAALQFGDIVDIPFPNVPPALNGAEWDTFWKSEVLNLDSMIHEDDVILVQGEMTYLFKVVSFLKTQGHRVVCATTERIALDNPDGTKTSVFRFCQFREY